MSEVQKVIIIGSGPAGWSAAIYTSRALLNPLVLGGEKSGGQLINTTEVENYPGFKDGVMGPELMMSMRDQAIRFGANIVDKNVTKVDFTQKPFSVWVGEEEHKAETVIVTTGAEAIMLNVPGEEKLLGRGVAVCAVCDAAFYKEKTTFVVGGGDAAIEDALALTRHAKKVFMIVRRDEFRASKIMQQKVSDHENIEIMWNTEVLEAIGEQKLEKIRVKNNKTNEEQELLVDGLFLAIGHKPSTEIFKDQLALDSKGYILTRIPFSKQSDEMAMSHLDENGLVDYPTMTSVDGVFAAGDVMDFRYQQAVVAAGHGAMAGLDAEKYLEQEVNK